MRVESINGALNVLTSRDPPMNRRRFLACAGALTLAAWPARGQERALKFADMHSHAGVGRRIDNMRALMAENGMLIVARAISTDRPVTHTVKGRRTVAREAQPGELAANFEERLAQLHESIRREGLTEIVSVETLEHVLAKRVRPKSCRSKRSSMFWPSGFPLPCSPPKAAISSKATSSASK